MKKIILAALCALLAVSMLANLPAFAADDTFTVAVENAEVGEGAESASFDVYFRDVTPKGLCAVKFFVTVEGGSFVEAAIGPDMPGSFMRGETGSETISFLWVDISKGVYEDTLAATFTVKLPAGAKKGDEIPVKITFDEDPDNYLAMEEDPATGENANITPLGKDGKITVVAAGAVDTKKPDDQAQTDGNGGDAQSGADTSESKNSDVVEDESGRIDIGTEVGIVTAADASDGTALESGEAQSASESAGGGLPLGAWIGIAAGAVAVIAAVVVAIVFSKKKSK